MQRQDVTTVSAGAVTTSPVASSGLVPLLEWAEPASRGVSRRRVLKAGFFAALFATLGGIGATIVSVLYPRGLSGFGGPVPVPASRIPAPGEAPLRVQEGRFLLVNLLPDEGRVASDTESSAGGLLALWQKCPHLGCTVPWKGDFKHPKDELQRKGMFNCNCHGSTYTKAGALVVGPATRAMDTMEIEVAKDGIVVQTGKIRRGTNDNPRLAVPYPRRRPETTAERQSLSAGA